MLQLITQDFDLPVPLLEAKLHLRVDHDDEDLMIDSYIRAASARLDGPDGYLGRCLTPKVWRLGLNQLRGTIPLPWSLTLTDTPALLFPSRRFPTVPVTGEAAAFALVVVLELPGLLQPRSALCFLHFPSTHRGPQVLRRC
mgnify:CR=1 FL=1